MKDNMKESNEFWKDIIYKDGKLDEEQVLKELSDYYFVLQEVPKVYCEITNGRLSKPHYHAAAVIAEFNDCQQENFKEWLKDECDDCMANAEATDV